jgi:hypothetical protein
MVPSGRSRMPSRKAKARPKRPASDVPTDLIKERETFVRTFLKKGFELTEDLLRENDKLRDENTRLRTQLASDDAIRELLRKVEGLEKEKTRLLTRSEKLAESSQRFENRQHEIEQELSDLANLYVASFQLHGTLSLRRVVRHVRELLAQLVGAESFVIYVTEADDGVARPIAWDGIEERKLQDVALGEGAIGEACAVGMAQVREPDGPGTIESPLAVIPLMAEGRAVGAIAILGLLEQKTTWAGVDQELFNLLGAHAATALIAANLYKQSPGPIAALRGLRENLED